MQPTAKLELLVQAVRDYLSEMDNKAPDYVYRNVLRERMRKALKAVEGA